MYMGNEPNRQSEEDVEVLSIEPSYFWRPVPRDKHKAVSGYKAGMAAFSSSCPQAYISDQSCVLSTRVSIELDLYPRVFRAVG